ncbi:MAG: hypothetical protein Q9163_003582 [Psora crenata]
MSPKEVIDLISSDGDTFPKPYESPQEDLTTKLAGTSNFIHLQDDHQSPPHYNDGWGAMPAKRRKLSPPVEEAQSPLLQASGKGNDEPGIATLTARSIAIDDDGWANIDDVDPIIFSSSAHCSAEISRPARRPVCADPVQSDNPDDSLPDDILYGPPHHSNHANLSERTAALLASLDERAPRIKSRKHSADQATNRDVIPSQGTGTGASSKEKVDDASAKDLASKPKKVKLTVEEREARAKEKEMAKEAKAREKELTKEQRAQEKEKEKERRLLEREGKAREKRVAAELAEVNRAKLDKKDSTPEMIVDLPASIDGLSVDTQAREFLMNLGVDATSYQSGVPNVIKWRRKMKAKWNAEVEHWEPLDHMVIEDEKHSMCLMSATEFVALATIQNNGEDVDTHVAKLKSAQAGCIPIYLIEGLHGWLRKNKAAENRAYQAQVLSHGQDDGETMAQQLKRRKKAVPKPVDEDLIEDALLRLQVINGCLIYHTNTPFETAEWIANLTQHISTIPYRQQRMNLSATFCMESGQVKSGDDRDDVFVKMLQEVVRVTPPIAFGIATEYPSVVKLMNAFRKHGPLVLENLQKSANRNGAFTDRKIGPAISRRLYKVFMERDPASTEV